ncbi:MAG: kelch repeat-containing protein [Flavobacteriales bacterium]
MIARYATLLLALGPAVANAQVWSPRTDFPYPVYSTYGFSIGERYFSGGGITDVVPLALVDSFYEYNSSTDVWIQRTALPGLTRYGTHGFSIPSTGKGFVVCGWHNNIPQVQLNDLWQYDPLADSWTQKTDFPGPPRYSLVSIGTSTKAYAGLGYNPWYNDWYEYDPATDSWAQKASFPGTVRQAANAFVLNDQVYVGMGATSVGGGTSIFFNDLYKYDPISDTWTTVAPLPASPRASSYQFSTCGLAYIIGGIGFDQFGLQTMYNDVWTYDGSLDQWTQLPDFPGLPMNTGTSFAIEGSGFIGFGGTGFEPFSWIPDTLTGAFWELKICEIISGAEETGGRELHAALNGGELVAQWDPAAPYDTYRLLDAVGRVVQQGRITDHGRLRIKADRSAEGVYLLQLLHGSAGRTVRMITQSP